jgi:hypothetical protein
LHVRSAGDLHNATFVIGRCQQIVVVATGWPLVAAVSYTARLSDVRGVPRWKRPSGWSRAGSDRNAVAACGIRGRVTLLGTLDRITGSLVLGSVTTAMLLGHWYLNTPSMKLVPSSG